mgnify:CR=1 FL=1
MRCAIWTRRVRNRPRRPGRRRRAERQAKQEAAEREALELIAEAVRAALEDARTLTDALEDGLLTALDAAAALEKRWDPTWHPEALRFTWRTRPAHEDAVPGLVVAVDRGRDARGRGTGVP